MMKIGLKNLDKLVDISKPQVILFTGTSLVDILSGDIANNVCLKQGYEVLEIVSHKKEYLIKRLMTNECNVDYRKWTLKNEYTDEELRNIGQATVNLIEVTKRLPTIVEQSANLYNLKDVTKLVEMWANENADRESIETLVVLDIFPLNNFICRKKEKYKSEIIKLFKDMSNISKKLRCPIIIVYDTHSMNTQKDNIFLIDEIDKFIDKCVVVNDKETTNNEFVVKVYDKNNMIETYNLKYESIYRRFISEE